MDVNKDVLETKWNEFRHPVLSWWNKRRKSPEAFSTPVSI